MSYFLLNITAWLEAHQLPCPFKQLTHFDCPGCGIQRSFVLMLKGDLYASFFMYPALIPIMLLFALLLLHLILKIKDGATILKYSYIFCTGVILVSYIYRIITTKTT
jgi:hypothetical protein